MHPHRSNNKCANNRVFGLFLILLAAVFAFSFSVMFLEPVSPPKKLPRADEETAPLSTILSAEKSKLRGAVTNAEPGPEATAEKIPQLTLENYEALTKDKKGVLVRFCASWVSSCLANFGLIDRYRLSSVTHPLLPLLQKCPYCKQLTPAWQQLAEVWNNEDANDVLVAEVNCDDIKDLVASPENSLCLRHTVKTPVIKYGDPAELGTRLKSYEGGHTFEDLNDVVRKHLVDVARKHLVDVARKPIVDVDSAHADGKNAIRGRH